eukprot:898966-Prymnesium_polylepis.1
MRASPRAVGVVAASARSISTDAGPADANCATSASRSAVVERVVVVVMVDALDGELISEEADDEDGGGEVDGVAGVAGACAGAGCAGCKETGRFVREFFLAEMVAEEARSERVELHLR